MNLYFSKLFIILTFLVGCGGPDSMEKRSKAILDVVSKKFSLKNTGNIDDATTVEQLQVRGDLIHIPNSTEPYSGFAKSVYKNGQLHYLIKFQSGLVSEVKAWRENGSSERYLKIENIRFDIDNFYYGDWQTIEDPLAPELQNKLRTDVRWYENGQLERINLFTSEGKNNGYISYFENGQKSVETEVENGLLKNSKSWQPNGEVSQHAVIMGEGESQVFHPNGKIRYEVTIKNGKANGEFISYHQNGSKANQGLYTDGNKNGEWIVYDEEGKILAKEKYTDGEYIPPPPPPETIKIAVIPKGTTHEYWQTIHAGAKKAEIELSVTSTPVSIVWKGALREDDVNMQIELVDTFINQQIDGIVLAPLDEKALVDPVSRAQGYGIPVVIIDSPLDSKNYLSFIGTDYIQGGERAGHFVAKQLQNKGKVLLYRWSNKSHILTDRNLGIMNALKQYSNITYIHYNKEGPLNRQAAYQVALNLIDRYGNEVDAIICDNAITTFAVEKALHNASQLKNKIKLVGFDKEANAADLLMNQDITGLVLTDPFKIGYEAVMKLISHLDGKKVEKRIDTGAFVVNHVNIFSEESKILLKPPIAEYLDQ